MKRTLKRTDHAGFTLVELLVAITVLAIVAVLGWRGLDTIVRARVGLTHELEQARGMQIAFAQLQADCDQIANATDIGGRRTLLVAPARITLVRNVFAENQPSRVQVVVYRLYDGKLMRFESPATRNLGELDTMWQSALSADGNQGIALQTGVTGMTVQSWYPDTPGWRNAETPGAGLNAGDSAPANAAVGTTLTQVAPTGLQVSLQLLGRDGAMAKVFLLGAS
ncbi:prepilin-type N-terminal cleavage/methylation domain-containing protein [Oxalobacteraceae bacterium OM1]|nr:prepilin-type N-terminal cleavage/methylation domain-containing protein [Oxalobacteraceae bacterium OM1]